MPRFGLRKVFDVGRGVRVFLNLQAGATRGSVPDPWRRNPSNALARKDRRVSKLAKKVKNQREDLFLLRNELEAMKRLAEGVRPDPSALRGSDEEIGALPDFVIVGAQKCGTGRLIELLAEHPNVEPGARKEAHYFDRPERYERGIRWYRGLFVKPESEGGRRTITGEKTPSYLFEPNVPGRMARVLPGARLISLLRNPVDRAYSHYHHLARRGNEDRGFERAIEEELAWGAEHGWVPDERSDPGVRKGVEAGLIARGIYVDQLARWREFFPEEQMLIVRTEDFFGDLVGTLEQVQDFLGLPRHDLAAHLRGAGARYEPMYPATRRRLEEFFEPHNRRLYDFLGRDFGW